MAAGAVAVAGAGVIVGSAAVAVADPRVIQGIRDDQRLEWMAMTMTTTTTNPW